MAVYSLDEKGVTQMHDITNQRETFEQICENFLILFSKMLWALFFVVVIGNLMIDYLGR